MLSGLVSNVQRYSLQDGPGIRTTVFFKGCPLDCWWCHNPEGRKPRPEMVVWETRCARCGECVRVCPVTSGKPPADGPPVPPSQCELCGECIEHCPTGARQEIGRRVTVAELLREIMADTVFFEESGGGATFSGGEPLMQADFLLAILEACRRRGIHRALDTCGFAPPDTLRRAAALADLVLYDLKLMDESQHLQFTGVANRLILDNARMLGQAHRNLWIRVPVIPGVNDHQENLAALAAFVRELPGVRQVNLIPYHRTGLAKVARLGGQYRLPEVAPPSPARLQEAASFFNAQRLPVKIGG